MNSGTKIHLKDNIKTELIILFKYVYYGRCSYSYFS